ncbi:MAG: LacI family transcriptional regulator [Bacteroidetes bacterium]|jgi:DNA-binding LacI/PurR family transcriptional regulator|nr:LacI family transcriptional regulator [Bacteroidota bacterium]
MSTLKEIAKAAGVSVSVASRALNPQPDKNARVSEETRLHVEKIAKKMGYRHNRAAEFLKRGKAPVIGVFLPETPNKLIAEMTFGISEQAEEEGFPLGFRFGLSIKRYRDFMESTSDSRHCGIISYPYHNLGAEVNGIMEKFLQRGGKSVFISDAYTVKDAVTVSIDDLEGGRIAGRHLLQKNCRSYYFFGSYNASAPKPLAPETALHGYALTRKRGYEEVIAESGQKVQWITDPNRAIDKILHSSATKLPCGIFCSADMNALHLYGCLTNTPLVIGRDVYVIGYDDLYLTPYLNPPLTTINQPMRELGKVAVTKIIRMIYGKEESSTVIPPRLVVRESA